MVDRNLIIKTLESKIKGFDDCISSSDVELNREWNKAIRECIQDVQKLLDYTGGKNE